jgi:hypothetical protein
MYSKIIEHLFKNGIQICVTYWCEFIVTEKGWIQ